MKNGLGGIAAILLALCLGGAAQAQTVVIGTNNGQPNAFPFGTSGYVGEYQQVYTSSAFSGPVLLTDVAFKTAAGFSGDSATENLTIKLSTTSQPVNGLSTNYAANIGPDVQTVFNGTKSFTAQSNNTFDLDFGLTPFTYDPANGNLLLDVFVNSSTAPGIGFVATTGSADTSRVFNLNGNGAPTSDPGVGLQTQFSFRPAQTSVPEPGAYALVVGLAVPGVMLLRRRRRT